jgi:hypothetical protein
MISSLQVDDSCCSLVPNISQTIFFEIFPSLIVLFKIFSRPGSFPSSIINWIDLTPDDATHHLLAKCVLNTACKRRSWSLFEGAWLECESVDCGARWILRPNARKFTYLFNISSPLDCSRINNAINDRAIG